MEQIYVLKLESNKWYIGKTTDIKNRYFQHTSGNGSAWTKKYKPIQIYEVKQQVSEHDENNITKDYMKKYGVKNVRGGVYCQVNLPFYQIKILELERQGNTNKCYNCNLSGHMANNCTREKIIPPIQSKVENTNNCTSEEIIPKLTLPNCISTFIADCLQYLFDKNNCSRCGRHGHYTFACYARTHANGNFI